MSKLIRLLFALTIGFTCTSIRAENATPAQGSVVEIPRGCEHVHINKAWKDLPENADLVDSTKISYSYQLLKCEGMPSRDKHFRLRLVSSDELVDELILPWSDNNPSLFYLEPDCEKKMQTPGSRLDNFIGAVGISVDGLGAPIQNNQGDTAFPLYEVGGVVWAWRFELKVKKLRMVSKKGLRCATDQVS